LIDWLEIFRPALVDGGESPTALLVSKKGEKLRELSKVVGFLWEETFQRKVTPTTLRYFKGA
jgi:hypothetical protein